MLHQEAADMREARDALARIRAEGGHAGIAYKNYMLPVRYAFLICCVGSNVVLTEGAVHRGSVSCSREGTRACCAFRKMYVVASICATVHS